jgi:hypothetical protein
MNLSDLATANNLSMELVKVQIMLRELARGYVVKAYMQDTSGNNLAYFATNRDGVALQGSSIPTATTSDPRKFTEFHSIFLELLTAREKKLLGDLRALGVQVQRAA